MRQFLARLVDIGSVFWRCIYSVGLTVICIIGLALLPQGRESLHMLGLGLGRGLFSAGWRIPIIIFSLLIWSLAAWYSARLTLGRSFGTHAPVDRLNDPVIQFWCKWLPRSLAVLPGAMLAPVFYFLGDPSLAIASSALALATGIFVWKRRVWFARMFPVDEQGKHANVRVTQMDRLSVIIVVVAITASFVLLAAIWWKPIEVTYYLVAPILLCTAISSWILFGDLVLTYYCKTRGLPSMAVLPLVLFVVCSASPWNDNHGVRLIEGFQKRTIERQIDTHLDDWLKSRVDHELAKGKPFPLFLVAAEGGGVRAAYWTGMILAKLQDESNLKFGRHVFALSGVSGGSLGNAVFASLVGDQKAGTMKGFPCADKAGNNKFQACSQQILERDFLSPTLGYMLYPDMLQRFLPYAFHSADRAKALEMAWENSWEKATGTTRFGQQFDRLWAADKNFDVPSLLLNATLVKGGNRVIESDLKIDARFPDAYDAFDAKLQTGQMRLSTAIHNSARFSYVSPAGTVSGCVDENDKLTPCTEHGRSAPWGRLIDGGYFENSGMETVRDLLFAMGPTLAKWESDGYRIEPVILVISNGPGKREPPEPLKAEEILDRKILDAKENLIAKDVWETNDIGEGAKLGLPFLSEVLSPPLGLYNTREARATFAVAAAKRDVAKTINAGKNSIVWFGIPRKTKEAGNISPPLGWAMAKDTVTYMNNLLGDAGTKEHPNPNHQHIDDVLNRLKTEN